MRLVYQSVSDLMYSSTFMVIGVPSSFRRITCFIWLLIILRWQRWQGKAMVYPPSGLIPAMYSVASMRSALLLLIMAFSSAWTAGQKSYAIPCGLFMIFLMQPISLQLTTPRAFPL